MTKFQPPSPLVLIAAELPVIDRGSGVRTLPLVGKWNGSTSITNGVTTFESGKAVARHTHNCDESVTILEGDAVCEIDGAEHRLTTGDAIYVPEGIIHGFRNAGDGVLKIHWTYASVDVTRTFPDTGETVRHLSPEDISQPKG